MNITSGFFSVCCVVVKTGPPAYGEGSSTILNVGFRTVEVLMLKNSYHFLIFLIAQGLHLPVRTCRKQRRAQRATVSHAFDGRFLPHVARRSGRWWFRHATPGNEAAGAVVVKVGVRSTNVVAAARDCGAAEAARRAGGDERAAVRGWADARRREQRAASELYGDGARGADGAEPLGVQHEE